MRDVSRTPPGTLDVAPPSPIFVVGGFLGFALNYLRAGDLGGLIKPL
jgi:hypothetical protein